MHACMQAHSLSLLLFMYIHAPSADEEVRADPESAEFLVLFFPSILKKLFGGFFCPAGLSFSQPSRVSSFSSLSLSLSLRMQEVLKNPSGGCLENMSFVMSNYFSMGVESRIGRGFDRHRSHSQLLNKMVSVSTAPEKKKTKKGRDTS